MALVLLGTTRCPICGSTIDTDYECYAFSHFVINKKDPLYFYTDSAFHKACIENDPLKAKADKFHNWELEASKPENRICMISGNLIDRMDRHIFIGLLTTNEDAFLYKFNYRHFDRAALSGWKERPILVAALQELNMSNKWNDGYGGKYLATLIREIESA